MSSTSRNITSKSGEEDHHDANMSFESIAHLLYSWRRAEIRPVLLNSVDTLLNQRIGPSQLKGPNDLATLCTVIRDKDCAMDADVYERMTGLLHALLKRPQNRKQLEGQVLSTVIESVKLAVTNHNVEASRWAILSMLRCLVIPDSRIHCIDSVPHLVNAMFVCAKNPTVQAASASIIQLIGETSLGRDELKKWNAIPALVSLLFHDSLNVVQRALSALQELTCDLSCCQLVGDAGGVFPIIALLGMRKSPDVTRIAAGVVQNLSRDKETVGLVQAAGATEAVTPLLLDSNPSVQCSAVGALLNLHMGDSESRATLKRVIALTIAEAAIADIKFLNGDSDDEGDTSDVEPHGSSKLSNVVIS